MYSTSHRFRILFKFKLGRVNTHHCEYISELCFYGSEFGKNMMAVHAAKGPEIEE
jgi:hypothetical protein